MKRSVRYGWLIVVLCVGLVGIGCASYYKVTDPQSGKEFYTQEVETLRGGAVKLKDASSGSIVTLQNSEVKEIDSNEYKAGLAATASKPTPAPAAAPSAAPAAEPGSAPSGTH